MANGRTNINLTKMPSPSLYYYGDGSLNTVLKGYEGLIDVNGEPWAADTEDIATATSTNFRVSGFAELIRATNSYQRLNLVNNQYNGSGYEQKFSSGTNSPSYTSSFTGEKTVYGGIGGGNLTGSLTISGFKLKIDGSYYTLKECVENGFIKPLVIIHSNTTRSQYIFETALNLYTGGSMSGSFPELLYTYMTNEGYEFQGVQFTASKAADSGDGWYTEICDIEEFRITCVE